MTTPTDVLNKKCIQVGNRGSASWPSYYTVEEYDSGTPKYGYYSQVIRPDLTPVDRLLREPTRYATRVIDVDAYNAQMRHMLGLD